MSRLKLLVDGIPRILDSLQTSSLWRILVLALAVFGIAAVCRVIRKTTGKIVMSVALTGITVVCAGILFTGNGIRSNAFTVSDDALAVAEYLTENYPDGQVYMPVGMKNEIRQYTSKVLPFSDDQMDEGVLAVAAEKTGRAPGDRTLLEDWQSAETGIVQTTGFLNAHPAIQAVVLETNEQTEKNLLCCGWKAETKIGGYTVYVSDQDGWAVTEYASDSGSQGLFYTLTNRKTGTLIIVDGGWAADEEQVRRVIHDHGGVVDAWFLTHYHIDHIEAFNKIYKDPQGIEIRQAYLSDPDPDILVSTFKGWDNPEIFAEFQEIAQTADNLNYLYRGDKLDIDGLRVKVFNAYSEDLPGKTNDLSNDLSLVLRFSAEKDSLLICADARGETIAKEMIDEFGDELHSTYLQLGHHGNYGLPDFFYDTVQAETAIFDSPGWLMNSEEHGCKRLHEYLEAKGLRLFDFSTAPNGFILH